MKKYAAVVLILLLILAGISVSMADSAKGGIVKKKEEVKMITEQKINSNPTHRKAGHWNNFKKPAKTSLRKILTPLQYEVTQEGGTEPPYRNEYEHNQREGIYVDIVSGEPLFSSKDKFDSGTGWPSFTKPLVPENIMTREDWSFLRVRHEVRSKHADSHLGHVFSDGPQPTGQRFCMNSASLRFIPRADLDKEGYGEYQKLFEEK